MAVQEKINNIQNEKDSLYMEILKESNRSNKVKDIVIFVLISIIAGFVAGLLYVLTNYDISYENNDISTDTGNACLGENCNTGDLNATN